MRCKFSRIIPVGMNSSAVKAVCVCSLLLSAAVSALMFFTAYCREYRSLLLVSEYGTVVNENAVMSEFGVLREDIFFGYDIFAIGLVLFAAYSFIYHFIGSKSIYTMRRLKKPAELAVRCLAVPFVFIAVSAISVFVLNFIYFGVYISVTPAECLLASANTMWRF